jgi:NAD-dependent dihydropyrimidine dehydrogenase PreA subunit
MFTDDIGSSGSGLKEISRAEVEEILSEAREKHLVPRPFRNQSDKTKADGICFCCDDCCGYFLDAEAVCDRGSLVERTDMERCAACGTCADVCYFDARRIEGITLAVEQDSCYGCGLCVDVCPQECVEMVGRE